MYKGISIYGGLLVNIQENDWKTQSCPIIFNILSFLPSMFNGKNQCNEINLTIIVVEYIIHQCARGNEFFDYEEETFHLLHLMKHIMQDIGKVHAKYQEKIYYNTLQNMLIHFIFLNDHNISTQQTNLVFIFIFFFKIFHFSLMKCNFHILKQ